jgi:hypothetical protein
MQTLLVGSPRAAQPVAKARAQTQGLTSLMDFVPKLGASARGAQMQPSADVEDSARTGDFNAYVCERCSSPCDAKAFSTCVCSACHWRVLCKISVVAGARVFSTD